MDKFEELMDENAGMSEDNKNKKIKEIEGDCVCPICPSYNQCSKEAGEKVFCIKGKSKECISNERGCMCPTCPFAGKYGIGVMHNFYCTRGSEIEQRTL